MKKITLALLILIALPLVVPSEGEAIPAFARKYGFNCMMCHTAYPKLNDWGQRFRDNGYQIPGQQGREKTVFDSPVPLALRTSAGLNGASAKADEHASSVTTSGFDLGGLDLLAGGVLHTNVSALIIYTPRIDRPASDFAGSGPSQLGTLESASLIFSNVVDDAVNVRVGRYEPAYHLFSSKRSYYLHTPYEIYGFPTYRNNFTLDDNQMGVEVTGHFRCGTKYGAGVVNGTGGLPDNNKFKDLYLTLGQTFGGGDGQSAGQRIAAFGYYGKQPTSLTDSIPAPTGEAAGGDNKAFYRYGGAAALNWRTLHLEAMYVWGRDDKALNIARPTESYDFSGGFAELDYAGLLNNKLIASALFNYVKPPDYDHASGKLTGIAGLVRYYLGDMAALNAALHGEYAYRRIERGEVTSTEHFYSLLVDFAF